jgi:hypothetical protein
MTDETSSKSGRTAAKPVDLKAEEEYWRKHHEDQPHASEGTTFEQFAPAYRVGAEAAQKYPGREFDEIEVDVVLDYEKHEVGSALPWDHVRGASKAAWAKVSGLISPREPARGIRSGI